MGAEDHSGAIPPTGGPQPAAAPMPEPAVLVSEPVPTNFAERAPAPAGAPFYPPASPPTSAVQGVVVAAPSNYGSYQTGSGPAAPYGAPPGGMVVNQASVKVLDTWAVPFFDCKGWKKIITSAFCTSCTTIEVEAMSERWADPSQASLQNRENYAMRLLPVLVMDALPCFIFGFPIFPIGSALTNMRNRRVYRTHYNIERGFCVDVLSTLCLPCSINQLSEQANRTGEGDPGMIVNQPILHASRAMV